MVLLCPLVHPQFICYPEFLQELHDSQWIQGRGSTLPDWEHQPYCLAQSALENHLMAFSLTGGKLKPKRGNHLPETTQLTAGQLGLDPSSAFSPVQATVGRGEQSFP